MTTVPPPADLTTDTIAAVAARRRTQRRPPAATTPPGGEPAPVAGAAPGAVVASRTLVASHLNATGPTGGAILERPMILEPLPATAMVLPTDADYVIAECDAEESMIPPGCYTPTSRLLWHKGWRIRRDLYESVMAAHAASIAAGLVAVAAPAVLPEGADQLPVHAIAGTAATPAAPTVLAAPRGGAPGTV